MGYFYSTRGWIEIRPIDDADLDMDAVIAAMRAQLSELGTDEQRIFYLKPWCWPEHINWTNYAFYGADVQREGIFLLEEALLKLTAFKDVHINGLFHIDGEETDSEHIVIRIKENKLFKSANDQAYRKGLGVVNTLD